MEPKELRIGNYIVLDGAITEVEMGLFDLWGDCDLSDRLEPIQLTPQILEDAGFTRKEGLSNIYDKNKIRVAVDIHALFYITKTGNVDFIGTVIYVHELQNAYPVFNSWQELTLNLNQLQ